MNIPLNINLQQILLHLFNFAILGFGLYFLLYKPVKDFMEKRKAHFEAMKQEAEGCLEKAKETEAIYAQRLEKAEEEIAAMRREAIAKDEERSRIRLEETEAKAAHILEEAKEKAQRQSSKILEEAQQQVGDMAVAAVKKLMQESLSESYDEFLSAAERSVADEQI